MCGKNWPKEWDSLMDQDLKDYFLEERFKDDVPESFFTYGYKFFAQYLDYKPFFTCFEKGEEVFENFYNIFGKLWDMEEERTLEELLYKQQNKTFVRDMYERNSLKSVSQKKKLTDERLKEILIRFINGINYLKKLVGREKYKEIAKYNTKFLPFMEMHKLYDIRQMEIKRITDKEFREEYAEDTLKYNSFIWEYIEDALDKIVWSDFQENFIMHLRKPLYELLGDYKVVNCILWPIAKKEDIENPFNPYVELNERGMEVYIADENTLVVVE